MTFAAFLVTIAIAAGAPSSTQISCNPALDTNGELGLTYFTTPAHVELSSRACAGTLILNATPLERRKIAKLNPRVDLPYLEAAGALAIAHESQHARGVHSEAIAEACAVKIAPALLAGRLAGSELAAAQRDVALLDTLLAPVYHGGVCDRL